MRSNSLIFVSFLALAGCSGSSSSGPAPMAITPEVSEARYQKLLTLGDDAITQKALDGKLGNCQLQLISETGCEGSRRERGSPIYVVNLVNPGIYFPTMTASADQFCKGAVGAELHLALEEGYCFTEHVSYDDFSDEGLSRQAYLGKLGKCRVDKISSDDGPALRRRIKAGECS